LKNDEVFLYKFHYVHSVSFLFLPKKAYRNATLRVWDIETGQCLHVLMGHVAAVRCVQYDGRRVVSGAYDFMVKVWDPETETCLHTLQGHTNRVYSLQVCSGSYGAALWHLSIFDGIHVVSGSLDTSIRVWDVETGNCIHTLTGHQSLTSGMELKDNILFIFMDVEVHVCPAADYNTR
uniref:Uncharacterized protein n=1 Tax=Malurus cyaneus samueli TaxID=2593467 RepID=A0A8C5TSI1_9PASS